MNILHEISHSVGYKIKIPTEKSKLFIATTLGSMGMSIVGVFIPVYMLNIGYTLREIIVYYIVYQIFGICTEYSSGRLTARFGPKHILRLSYGFRLIFMLCILNLDSHNSLIYILPFIHQASDMLFVPIHVELSKFSSNKDSGSNISKIFMFTRIASAFGPLLGGLMATYIAIEMNIVLAFTANVLAIVTLWGHKEPVRTKQTLKLKTLPMKRILPIIKGDIAVAFEYLSRVHLFPVFLAVFILGNTADYDELGLVITLSMVVSVVYAFVVGKLSDKGKINSINIISTSTASIGHIVRGFTSTVFGAGLLNLFTDASASGTRIVFYKKAYDTVNNLEGYRISFFTALGMVSATIRTFIMVLLLALSYIVDEKLAFTMVFIVSGLNTLWFLKVK